MSENRDARQPIRITLTDLETVTPPQSYGAVPSGESAAADAPVERGSRWRQASVYLGVAGAVGALLAWAICEPWFIDGGGHSWANFLVVPLMVILVCVSFGVAEGIAEHSARRAANRALLASGLGLVLGFFLFFAANFIFAITAAIAVSAGKGSFNSPVMWMARALAWMVFGVSGGLVYGVIGQSAKRCGYGVLGGVLGAGLGGFVFDPIALALREAAVSRAVGFAIFGAATGVAIGLVENALKDRWLYVSAGPLAGKQFVLYKAMTTMGSSDDCDLYLFKDASIQPQHARIELRGPLTFLSAAGPVLLNGRMVRETALHSGDYLQVGRYGFHYRDRERAAS
jgi:hypothetical protein